MRERRGLKCRVKSQSGGYGGCCESTSGLQPFMFGQREGGDALHEEFAELLVNAGAHILETRRVQVNGHGHLALLKTRCHGCVVGD